MNKSDSYLKSLLGNLRTLREKAGMSANELEERLILGPGWITRFENGETTPSIDMLLAILHGVDAKLNDLLDGLPLAPDAAEVERYIFAEQVGTDVAVHFHYSRFDAVYILKKATVEEFEVVVKTLRDGLSGLVRVANVESSVSESIKADAVMNAFLKAVNVWPHANPSDLWWFLIYRAYCDPYNHPARFARLDFIQSWKRTGGWALERVLVQHYSPFLKAQGINLFIADDEEKEAIISKIDVGERLEADKMDVLLTSNEGEFLGVVHVKASLAERRTDDQPMSAALKHAGFISPFWTMDCKSTPAAVPVNRGELGRADGQRSAKRKDIEDEGYFTGCFSYNTRTEPSSDALPAERRVYVCDFVNPDDAFSQFIFSYWKRKLGN